MPNWLQNPGRRGIAGFKFVLFFVCLIPLALLSWGFTEWPWLRLSWRCSSANVASQRTAERAGLQREGVLRSHEVNGDGVRRDTFCYAHLRDEWSRLQQVSDTRRSPR